MKTNSIITARRPDAEHGVSLTQRRIWNSDVAPGDAMATLLSVVDTPTASYLDRPAREAFAKAETVVRTDRYTPEHKRQTIGELFQQARAEVQERYDAEIQAMDAALPKLQQLAIGPASPKPDEAAALLYTRDSLQARTANMNDADVAKLWDAALSAGDLTTARVLSEFLPAWGRWKHKGQTMPPPQWFDKAREETELKLMTPEQRKARETVAADKQRRMALGIIKNKALAMVNAQFQINRDGTLTDGHRAEESRRFRATW